MTKAIKPIPGLPEFCVDNPHTKRQESFDSWKDACARAVEFAASHGESAIDVVCCSEDEARSWGGDDAVERYRDDPDASVFERYEVKVNYVGRVP